MNACGVQTVPRGGISGITKHEYKRLNTKEWTPVKWKDRAMIWEEGMRGDWEDQSM